MRSEGFYGVPGPRTGRSAGLAVAGSCGNPHDLARGDQRPADDFRDLGDDGIAQAMQAVHPSGNPMSHSTHVGFRAPPATAPKSGPWLRPTSLAAPSAVLTPFVPSVARGVGKSFTAAGKPFRGLVASKSPRFWESFARGVGHSRTAIANPICFPVASRRSTVGSVASCLLPSVAFGVGQRGAKKLRGDRPPERIAEAFVFDASGVGNNPEPVAAVRGANGGSRYAVPPCIVPERGQVSENDSKSSTKERCNIFHDDDARSNFANQSRVFTPETGACAREASTLAGEGKVLAWETAAQGVNANAICSQSVSGEGADVVIGRHLGPMVTEQVPALRGDLAESARPVSRGLKAQRKSADAREQVEEIVTTPVATASPTERRDLARDAPSLFPPRSSMEGHLGEPRREIQPGEGAKQAKRRGVVCATGRLLRGEHAKKFALAIARDPGLPQVGAFSAAVDALEAVPRRAPIQVILGASAKAQISAPIVERIAVDVIHESAGPCAHKFPMKLQADSLAARNPNRPLRVAVRIVPPESGGPIVVGRIDKGSTALCQRDLADTSGANGRGPGMTYHHTPHPTCGRG